MPARSEYADHLSQAHSFTDAHSADHRLVRVVRTEPWSMLTTACRRSIRRMTVPLAAARIASPACRKINAAVTG